METCIYFVEKPEFLSREGPRPPVSPPEGARLLLRGGGFTAAGRWRAPAPQPGAAGLILDDRFLPDRRGAAAALRALEDWPGLLVLDLERRPGPAAAELTELLARLPGPERIALPPVWDSLPHGALLLGPRRDALPLPGLPRARENALPCLADGPPLRHLARPGGAWRYWAGALPEAGLPCPGAGCLQRRLPDGSVLLWDTKKTLTARCRAAGVCWILFREDWDPLPEGGREEL
ncbi:MAG: hypothetical protein IKQ04_10075 [Oscillospiraceae bacterium]|nr:hypothetical protein [Oscillospiraceae bacterium]